MAFLYNVAFDDVMCNDVFQWSSDCLNIFSKQKYVVRNTYTAAFSCRRQACNCARGWKRSNHCSINPIKESKHWPIRWLQSIRGFHTGTAGWHRCSYRFYPETGWKGSQRINSGPQSLILNSRSTMSPLIQSLFDMLCRFHLMINLTVYRCA
jgi:hypothetical protein